MVVNSGFNNVFFYRFTMVFFWFFMFFLVL